MNMFKNNIIATDLDNTLIGDSKSLQQLLNYLENDFSTIYITGRHKQSAIELLSSHQIPMPEVLICDAGATIYNSPEFEQDTIWKQLTKKDWQPQKIKAIMEFSPSIKKQNLPNEERLSYTILDSNIAKIAEIKLLDHDISCHCIYSSGKDFDILPAYTNKGTALQYVLRNAPSDAHILVAGDSGNDSDMLTQGYPAVIVGNHQPELEKLTGISTIYFAKKYYAAGIQEGWSHFHSPIQIQPSTHV
ncbi:HAD-IIB family hydrolase [Rummeliibacillus sp. JY-2-4R]